MMHSPNEFWSICMADRLLWLQAVERATEDQARAELAHWQSIFGPAVTLERFDTAEELVVAHIALAIAGISKDGTGVRPEHLTQLGFQAFHVERHFKTALGLVRDKSGPKPYPAPATFPANVLPFPRRDAS